MYSSVIIIMYTLATALVPIWGQETAYAEPDRPHKYTEIGYCRQHRHKLKESLMSAVLGPRERQVVLKPDRGFEFNPKTVTVKRCVGACVGGLSPMPRKQEPKSFVVARYRKGRGVEYKNCVHVTVMEHADCKCGCAKDESSCNEFQYWDESHCDCSCKDDITRRFECEARENRAWNDQNCSCPCHYEIEGCPNGMRLDDKTCTRCKCIENESDCNKQQQWNEPRCACLCEENEIKKSGCEATGRMVWNDKDCSCQCRNKIMECPSGMQWDDLTCECMSN